MQRERDLFGWGIEHDEDLAIKKMSRRTDPVTSHEAATELVDSGGAAKQRTKTLNALRTLGPCTSAELAQSAHMDRYVIARRLPDLARIGLASRGQRRKCRVTGRTAIVWSTP
mgnify:FL=1